MHEQKMNTQLFNKLTMKRKISKLNAFVRRTFPIKNVVTNIAYNTINRLNSSNEKKRKYFSNKGSLVSDYM